MSERTCPYCEKSFAPNTDRQVYCGLTCANRDRGRKRTRPCLVDGCGEPRKGNGYCGNHLWRFTAYGSPTGEREPDAETCGHCGGPMPQKGNQGPRRLYCSKRCADRASEQTRTQRCTEPGCDKPHRAKGYCGSHYNQHFPPKQPKREVPCTVCDTLVARDKRNDRQPVCSDMCKVKLTTGHWPICMVADKPKPKLPRREMALAKLQASIADGKPRRTFYAGWCQRCRKPFVDRRHEARWCSDRCGLRAGRARRRAVKRAAFVEDVSPIEIYERDGWRCQIPNCMFRSRLVARTKVVPDPKAPVLDHIVPLAKGGKHERSNVQCAHFMCNSMKGDRAAGDQLLLFG